MCVCVLSRVQLCDPLDCDSPGSSVYGILQAGILKWVVISFFKGSSQPRDQTLISCIFLHWQADALPLHHLGNPCMYVHIHIFSCWTI